MEENYDYVAATVDEIALEGLDGITLSALWLRLRKRPHFPLNIDNDSKAFIWNFLSCHPEIEFYELPEPRKPLVLFNRYDYVDLDIGVVCEPENLPEDIYPFNKIDENGVRGSCITFHTRKIITEYIRDDESQLMDLQSMVDRWNEKLVLVASQSVRNFALLGSEINPQIKLNIIQYCMLERIGRSRYHGEVTQGKTGLSVLNEPVKTLHYYRKLLVQKQLITKQVHYQRTRNGQTSSGGLLHLKRFYMERRSKMQLLLQNMSEKLCQKHDHREVFTKLRSELGVKDNVFKKIFQKPFQPYVRICNLKYREVYPNASKEEAFVSNGNEKMVKMVELIKPYDEAEEDEDNEKDSHLSNEKFFDPKNFVIDRPLLCQIYAIVKSSGPEGISAQEIGKKAGLPKLEMRLLCRNLERKSVVGSFMQDRGRQRVTKYVAKKLVKESNICKQILVERKKLEDLSFQQNITANNEKSVVEANDLSEVPLIMEDSRLRDITVEIEEIRGVTGKKTDSSVGNITSLLKKISYEDKKKENYYSTHRSLKRAVTVIETVQKLLLIEDVHKLQKLIHEREVNEGLDGKIDKKSMLRLIQHLAEDGYITVHMITMTCGDQIKKLQFVSDPSITMHDQCIKTEIDKAKFKYFTNKETIKSQQKASEKQTKEITSVDKSIKELHQLCDKTEAPPMQFVLSMGRTYGLEPKFIRMKSLYTFLFYLVYDYQGQFSNNVDGPPIYHVESGWKMFIPPLPKHSGIPEGWCLISDILLNMPLSVFVRVVNITHRIEGIETYLNDPIKQHYLIRHLPDKLRSAIMIKRRYIFAVHEVATKLSFMGLFSFGPQKQKEKDQTFIYVHRHTCIVDTTTSKPGYLHVTEGLEYSKKHYFLKTLENVEAYWLDLEMVCLHTPLGSFNSARGQSITVENAYQKPAMIEASRNKQFDEIMDDGKLPGDKRGAAGLDSALYSHLKRNWSWPSMSHRLHHNLHRFNERNIKMTENANSHYMQYLLQKNNPTAQELPDRRKRLSRLHNLKRNVESLSNVTDPSTEKNVTANGKKYKKRLRPVDEKSQIPSKKRKPSTVVRTINRKFTKKRKPYYDDKDKDALEKMSKLRVDWTAQEDSILLLCKVTSCLLNPHCNGMVVPYTCVRDFLHEKIPTVSSNKTSRACQRRVRYMLLNPATSSNVSVFLTEARQDKDLMTLYQGPKPPMTNVEAWSQMFTALLNRLLIKFTLSASDRCEKIALPRTVDELHANYQMIVTGELPGRKPQHQYPQSVTNIYESVVHALFMCSLCSVGDKNNWTYILYKLYQEYPDSMLHSVVARIRRDQMVTKKKHVGKRIMQTLPLSSLPYHLSVNYYNTLLTPFQPKIYQECYNFLDKLIDNSQSKGVEVYEEEIPGIAACIIGLVHNFSLTFEIQIPDQILLFKNTLSDKQHSEIAKQMKQMESEEDAINTTPLDDSFTETTTKNITKKLSGESVDTRLSLHTSTSSDEPPRKKRCLEKTENSKSRTSCSDYDYNFSLDTDRPSSSTNSNVSFESSSGPKASRIALYMLRQRANAQKEVAIHPQDDFVVNACHVSCRLREGASENLTIKINCDNVLLNSDTISEIINSQRKCITDTTPCFDSLYNLSDFDDTDKIFGKKIYSAIYEQKEFGLTKKELLKMFGNVDNGKKVKKHLNYMTEGHIVLRVGIICFQYVCYEFSKPWILSSYRIPKELKSHASEEMKRLTENDNVLAKHEAQKTKASLVETHAKDNALETEQNSVIKTFKADPEIIVTDTSTECKVQNEQLPCDDPKGQTNLDDKVSSEIFSTESDLSKTLNSKPSNSEINSTCEKSLECNVMPQENCTELNKNSERICQRKLAMSLQKQNSLSSNSSSGSTKNWERVKFVARSWRKPNGTLNHSVLNKLLSAVLGHIMAFPGKTEQQICNHFMAALQPVQVLELIEILTLAQCVQCVFLKTSHVASLFSKPIQYELLNEESADSVCHVEATADAVVKFSQLSEVLVNERVKTPKLFLKTKRL